MELDHRALADRIHDAPLQLLGSALLKAEMCEQLLAFGRTQELPSQLEELRSVLEQAALDLRAVMADLRSAQQGSQNPSALTARAALLLSHREAPALHT